MRYEPRHPRCRDCPYGPHPLSLKAYHCRPAWLYVAHDPALNLVKIGKTVNLGARLQLYRKTRSRAIQFVARHQPSCDWAILDFEDRALALLPSGKRVRGDWYDVDPGCAIRAAYFVSGGA